MSAVRTPAQPTGAREEALSIIINNSRPVELATLSSSLEALARARARFAEDHGATINGDAVRLFIREIKTGSIIFDLVSFAANIPMFAEHVATIVGFSRNLIEIVKFFDGKRDQEPEGMRPRDALDVSQFLTPVANDARSSLSIHASDSATVQVTYTIDSNGANAVQNRAANWIARHAEPVHGLRTGQLFYFYQARDDAQATTGDRGIIEAISASPVKTIFASEAAKQAMLNEALFRKAYVVDVDIQTIEGKPRLYKIMAVTDSIDRE